MSEILKKTISLLNAQERRKLVLLAVLNIMVSLLDIAALAFLVFLVNYFTAVHPVSWPNLLINFSMPDVMAGFLVFFILKSLLGYFASAWQYRFVYGTASRISGLNLLKYLDGTYQDFVNVDSSVLQRRISQEPIEFGHYVLQGLQQIFSEGIMVLISLSAIALYNITLLGLLFAVLAPSLFIMAWFSRRVLRTARKQVKDSSEKAIQYLNESLSGYIESHIYDREAFFTKKYTTHQKKLNGYLAHLQSVQVLPSRLTEVFAVLGFFVLVLGTGYYGHTGMVSIAVIGAFMAAAYKIIPGIVKMQNLAAHVKTYSYTVDDLIDMQHIHKNEPTHDAAPLSSLAFSDVSFVYRNELTVNRFSMQVSVGQIVGISGDSGRGKSTIINLLLGFLEEASGDIACNGRVAKSAERQGFWPDIAYVKQQPFMIYDTLLQNIVLGDEHVDENKLQFALSASGLDVFVASEKDGLDKVITENGKNISGGQRQRIAIARAFYKDAALLILDEPFNELDPPSEQKILDHCRQMAHAGKMIILVAHHGKSLEYCDKIYYA